MHELSVVLEIFELVEEIMKEQGLKEVSTVEVEVGELSGILPEYFRECWNAARIGSVFNNTELTLDYKPAMARCCCGTVYEMNSHSRICPECSKTDYTVISGREFMVNKIVAK